MSQTSFKHNKTRSLFLSQIYYPKDIFENDLVKNGFIIGWNLNNFRCFIGCVIPIPDIVTDDNEYEYFNVLEIALKYAAVELNCTHVPIILGLWKYGRVSDTFTPKLYQQSRGIWMTLCRDQSNELKLVSVYSLGSEYLTSSYIIEYERVNTNNLEFMRLDDSYQFNSKIASISSLSTTLSDSSKQITDFRFLNASAKSKIQFNEDMTAEIEIIIELVNSSHDLQQLVEFYLDQVENDRIISSNTTGNVGNEGTVDLGDSNESSHLIPKNGQTSSMSLWNTISFLVFLGNFFDTIISFLIPCLENKSLFSWWSCGQNLAYWVGLRGGNDAIEANSTNSSLPQRQYNWIGVSLCELSLTAVHLHGRLLIYKVLLIQSVMFIKSWSSFEKTATLNKLSDIHEFDVENKNNQFSSQINDFYTVNPGKPAAMRLLLWRDTMKYLLLIWFDMILGLITSYYLFTRKDDLLKMINILLYHLESRYVKDMIYWFNNNPGGVKLNPIITKRLGYAVLYLIRSFEVVISSYLRIFHMPAMLIFIGSFIGGFTLQIMYAIDIIRILTLHINIFHRCFGYLYNYHCQLISSLFYLFCGQKKNILRKRIDTCEYDLYQLLLCIALFAMAIFLFPSFAVYFYLFAILDLMIVLFNYVLWIVVICIKEFPFYVLVEVVMNTHNRLQNLFSVFKSCVNSHHKIYGADGIQFDLILNSINNTADDKNDSNYSCVNIMNSLMHRRIGQSGNHDDSRRRNKDRNKEAVSSAMRKHTSSQNSVTSSDLHKSKRVVISDKVTVQGSDNNAFNGEVVNDSGDGNLDTKTNDESSDKNSYIGPTGKLNALNQHLISDFGYNSPRDIGNSIVSNPNSYTVSPMASSDMHGLSISIPRNSSQVRSQYDETSQYEETTNLPRSTITSHIEDKTTISPLTSTSRLTNISSLSTFAILTSSIRPSSKSNLTSAIFLKLSQKGYSLAPFYLQYISYWEYFSKEKGLLWRLLRGIISGRPSLDIQLIRATTDLSSVSIRPLGYDAKLVCFKANSPYSSNSISSHNYNNDEKNTRTFTDPVSDKNIYHYDQMDSNNAFYLQHSNRFVDNSANDNISSNLNSDSCANMNIYTKIIECYKLSSTTLYVDVSHLHDIDYYDTIHSLRHFNARYLVDSYGSVDLLNSHLPTCNYNELYSFPCTIVDASKIRTWYRVVQQNTRSNTSIDDNDNIRKGIHVHKTSSIFSLSDESEDISSKCHVSEHNQVESTSPLKISYRGITVRQLRRNKWLLIGVLVTFVLTLFLMVTMIVLLAVCIVSTQCVEASSLDRIPISSSQLNTNFASTWVTPINTMRINLSTENVNASATTITESIRKNYENTSSNDATGYKYSHTDLSEEKLPRVDNLYSQELTSRHESAILPGYNNSHQRTRSPLILHRTLSSSFNSYDTTKSWFANALYLLCFKLLKLLPQ